MTDSTTGDENDKQTTTEATVATREIWRRELATAQADAHEEAEQLLRATTPAEKRAACVALTASVIVATSYQDLLSGRTEL